MRKPPEPLKCEECEKAGVTYTLRWGGVFPRTLMAFRPFADEEGRPHYHDRNTGGGEYWLCSNGHYVTEPRKETCWCGWPLTGKWAEADRARRKAAEAA